MADEPPAGANQNRQGGLLWLTCLVCAYPLYFLISFLIHALPGLIQARLFGTPINYIRVSWRGVIVIAGTPGALSPHPSQPSPSILLLATLLAVALAGLSWLALGAQPLLASLALAMLGQTGLEPLLGAFSHPRNASLEIFLQFILYFSLLTLGLRQMLAGVTVERYCLRVRTLLACFSVPLGLIWGIRLFSLRFSNPSSWILTVLMPGVVAVLPASWHGTPRGKTPPREITWKPLAAGLAATLIIPLGTGVGGRALNRRFEQARRAANRLALASLPALPMDLPYPKLFFQKGVNFTAEFPETYDSEGARQMLEALPQFGINAVALVPYGWSPGNLPTVEFNPEGSWENDEGLEELSRLAHARGIKVLLKPALWKAYDLEFPSPQDRSRWFAQYETFLEHYARLATKIHADVFCVGGEFSKLTPDEAAWRQLIAHVRKLYPGPLVYAANFGSEFEGVKFWDALDYIGLQEYYPLPEDLSTDEVVRRVEAVQEKFGKPVIFTEVGFPSLENANRKPWDDAPGRISPQLQARCYDAIFQAFYPKPWFQGMYWWKVETNGSGGPADGSHSPWGKPAMDVLRRWYIQGGR